MCRRAPEEAMEATVDWFTDPQAWMALLTLTMLEIVLGIDNIVFISILAGRLPEKQQPRVFDQLEPSPAPTASASTWRMVWARSG